MGQKKAWLGTVSWQMNEAIEISDLAFFSTEIFQWQCMSEKLTIWGDGGWRLSLLPRRACFKVKYIINSDCNKNLCELASIRDNEQALTFHHINQ